VWSSKYRFLVSWKAPIIDTFTGMNDLRFFSQLGEEMRFGASLWDYYLEYWKLRKQENVLIICYEDLEIETKRFIPLIASFMKLPSPSEDLIALVLDRSSKQFMTKHNSVFNESWVHKKLIEMGRHEDPSQFVAAERIGESEPVNEEVQKLLQGKWEELMKETGCETYSAFREKIRKITEERFAELSHHSISEK